MLNSNSSIAKYFQHIPEKQQESPSKQYSLPLETICSVGESSIYSKESHRYDNKQNQYELYSDKLQPITKSSFFKANSYLQNLAQSQKNLEQIKQITNHNTHQFKCKTKPDEDLISLLEQKQYNLQQKIKGLNSISQTMSNSQIQDNFQSKSKYGTSRDFGNFTEENQSTYKLNQVESIKTWQDKSNSISPLPKQIEPKSYNVTNYKKQSAQSLNLASKGEYYLDQFSVTDTDRYKLDRLDSAPERTQKKGLLGKDLNESSVTRQINNTNPSNQSFFNRANVGQIKKNNLNSSYSQQTITFFQHKQSQENKKSNNDVQRSKAYVEAMKILQQKLKETQNKLTQVIKESEQKEKQYQHELQTLKDTIKEDKLNYQKIEDNIQNQVNIFQNENQELKNIIGLIQEEKNTMITEREELIQECNQKLDELSNYNNELASKLKEIEDQNSQLQQDINNQKSIISEKDNLYKEKQLGFEYQSKKTKEVTDEYNEYKSQMNIQFKEQILMNQKISSEYDKIKTLFNNQLEDFQRELQNIQNKNLNDLSEKDNMIHNLQNENQKQLEQNLQFAQENKMLIKQIEELMQINAQTEAIKNQSENFIKEITSVNQKLIETLKAKEKQIKQFKSSYPTFDDSHPKIKSNQYRENDDYFSHRRSSSISISRKQSEQSLNSQFSGKLYTDNTFDIQNHKNQQQNKLGIISSKLHKNNALVQYNDDKNNKNNNTITFQQIISDSSHNGEFNYDNPETQLFQNQNLYPPKDQYEDSINTMPNKYSLGIIDNDLSTPNRHSIHQNQTQKKGDNKTTYEMAQNLLQQKRVNQEAINLVIQITKLEAEIKTLDEEYQSLQQKYYACEVGEERSTLRSKMLEVTEKLQTKNQELFQLRKLDQNFALAK